MERSRRQRVEGLGSAIKRTGYQIVGDSWYAILDFIFPPLCLSCSIPLLKGRQTVCDPCWNSIERVSALHPLYVETSEKLMRSEQVNGLVSEFVFEREGAFQHIAHALKYGGYESLGVELGRKLAEVFLASGGGGDVLVPIPLHKRKFRERGYNQAERIAHGMSQATLIPLRTDLLRRTRFTQSQTTLTLEERKKNVEGAFEIVPGMERVVNGKTIVLIDDVITTGATIVSCASTLRDAGARTIIASSAALAC